MTPNWVAAGVDLVIGGEATKATRLRWGQSWQWTKGRGGSGGDKVSWRKDLVGEFN